MTATQVKKQRNTHSLTCQHCTTSFTSGRKDAAVCSERCKKARQRARQSKLDDKRLSRFTSNAFVHWLADNAKRAGTLEVIPKTLSALTELHGIYTYCMHANGFGTKDRTYSVCHIAPVTSKSYIGTVYPQNLCVADAKLNAGFKNKHYKGFGHRILKAKLSQSLRVDSKATPTSIIQSLIQYLGHDLVCRMVVSMKLQPTKLQQLLDWFAVNFDHYSDRLPCWSELVELKTPELSKLKDTITNKRPFAGAGGYAYRQRDVFSHELKRLSKHYQFFANLLSEHPLTVREDFRPDIDPELQKQQFFVLHGAPVAELLAALSRVYPANKVRVVEVRPIVIREQTAAEFNAWLADLQETFPELAESYSFKDEGESSPEPVEVDITQHSANPVNTGTPEQSLPVSVV